MDALYEKLQKITQLFQKVGQDVLSTCKSRTRSCQDILSRYKSRTSVWDGQDV